jgi:dephospho-CoA kinase
MTFSQLRLGLTGGIGSGKSTVARRLQSLGATLIDADAIAQACTGPGGAAMPAVSAVFGPTFVTADGALDRQRMRERVFTQPAARAQLEAIVHPLVGVEIFRQAAASCAPCTVFDVPLLVESPRWRPQLDRVLVVDCGHEAQVLRVMARNGWDRVTIESIIANQASRSQRLAAADIVLHNEGLSVQQLLRQVDRLAGRFGL